MKYMQTTFATLILFLSLSLQAGLVVTVESDGEREVTYFSKGKSATYSADELQSLVFLDDDLLIEFNSTHKIYTRIKISELAKNMQDMMNDQMEMMAESPFFEAFMAMQKQEHERRAELGVNVRSIGKKTIGGVEAEGYSISVGDEKLSERWVSPTLKNSIVRKGFDYSVIMEAAAKTRHVLSEWMGEDPVDAAELEIDSKGFLVRQVEFNEFTGQMEVFQNLVSVTEERVPASRFEIPDHFNEVDWESFHHMEDDEEDLWDDDY